MESQIINGLAGLLFLIVSAAVSYLVPKAEKLIDAHLNEKQANIANKVIDGLGTIAENTVKNFNQKVVNDAKEAGAFTPQLAESVKNDAVQAVKSQGASLLSLGKNVLGDTESLVNNIIESAVDKNHVDTPVQVTVKAQEPTISATPQA